MPPTLALRKNGLYRTHCNWNVGRYDGCLRD